MSKVFFLMQVTLETRHLIGTIRFIKRNTSNI